ncbi:TMhelix containing protein [Vibrio phage 1.081.O._10N.286.52.C2]|nr:TMhelix containing protein [Vibrio phage 1.081.O._10N.286.52.C2]
MPLSEIFFVTLTVLGAIALAYVVIAVFAFFVLIAYANLLDGTWSWRRLKLKLSRKDSKRWK